MTEFIIKNASAVFALIGALSGALITGLINYLSKSKDTKLKIIEKLLDRKLEAHESLINITNTIRTMVLHGGDDSEGELKRGPLIMQSRNNMDDFLNHFMQVQGQADRWLSAPVKREVSLFLDYFVNVNEYARNASDVSLQEVGVLIRHDFIDFALRLENCAHNFFNNDLMKLKFRTDRDWHKYPKEKTFEELNKTQFSKNKVQIINMLRI